ncbi:MAG: hypothetical protein ACRD1B_05800, partial [Thermoanaerobaculia bacterium]
MKRLFLAVVALAAAWPMLPQTASEPAVFTLGQIDLGVQLADPDTESSKFREYRDVPNGVVLPFLRLFGEKGVRYDLIIQDARQDDGRYRLFVDSESVRVKADYNLIPHRFGNRAVSLLQPTGQGVLEISDTIQQANQSALEAQF